MCGSREPALKEVFTIKNFKVIYAALIVVIISISVTVIVVAEKNADLFLSASVKGQKISTSSGLSASSSGASAVSVSVTQASTAGSASASTAASKAPAQRSVSKPAPKIPAQTASQPLPTVTVQNTPPAPPASQGQINSQPPSPTGYWGDTGMTNINKVYEYGKTLLSPAEQSVYDQIAAGVLNVNPSISISTTADTTDIEKIWQYYLSDHAEVFYVTGVELMYPQNENGGTYKYTVEPAYSYNGSTVNLNVVTGLRAQMDAAAGNMIAAAKAKLAEAGLDSGDAYNMEKALHDEVIAAFSYDMAAAGNPSAHPESFTSCGAFVNGTAVCEGYAKAMKLLLDSQGIESLYVTGTATTSGGTGGHAWNIVQIGNVWYDLDSTFDDPVYVTHSGYDTSNKVPSYTYFNITSFPLYNGQPDHTQGVFNSGDPFDSENYAVMPVIG